MRQSEQQRNYCRAKHVLHRYSCMTGYHVQLSHLLCHVRSAQDHHRTTVRECQQAANNCSPDFRMCISRTPMAADGQGCAANRRSPALLAVRAVWRVSPRCIVPTAVLMQALSRLRAQRRHPQPSSASCLARLAVCVARTWHREPFAGARRQAELLPPLHWSSQSQDRLPPALQGPLLR